MRPDKPNNVIEHRDLVRLLRAAVEREGGQTAFAKRHGINRVHLNRLLRGKKNVGDAVAKALGLRKVYIADHIMEQGDLIRLLRAAVEREGGQSAFAKRHGIDRVRLNRLLRGHGNAGDVIAKALGLRKMYIAE
jgi:DNA-binding phage protein